MNRRQSSSRRFVPRNDSCRRCSLWVFSFVWALAGPAATARAAPPSDAAAGPWRAATAEVRGSIAGSLVTDPPEEAARLSAVAARVVMWDLDLRKELERGDRLDVVYRSDGGHVPVVGATRYRSGRRAATFEAFLFQAPDDPFPSYWSASGEEVPRRLRDGPLRSYEQITSLLKDRPTHRGMDFKAPVGTPVVAHRSGQVSRANWRHGPNGNCLEIAFDDGTKARYLHLAEVKVRPGTPVRRGQVVALTGNTGRSTAPHLHYELERGGRIVDPIDHHGTVRRTLPAAARPRFAEWVKEMRARFDSAPKSGGAPPSSAAR